MTGTRVCIEARDSAHHLAVSVSVILTPANSVPFRDDGETVANALNMVLGEEVTNLILEAINRRVKAEEGR
jgi:hypothetical protein